MIKTVRCLESFRDQRHKAYAHIAEVCEQLTRLSRIMRAHWAAETALRARQWAQERESHGQDAQATASASAS